MGTGDSIGSIFGKAKKWAQQELKNATKFSGDPMETKRDQEAQDDLAREIERDAEQARDDAIVSALTPQSLKDYQAMTAAERVAREAEAATKARADRAARASASRVELSGEITGIAEPLAVDSTMGEDPPNLFVSVECIDPVPMSGATLRGFCFAIPDFHGDGRYILRDSDDFDSLQYEVYVVEESEGWAYHPTFGPGVIVVDNGVADVSLIIGGSGSGTFHLHASVVL